MNKLFLTVILILFFVPYFYGQDTTETEDLISVQLPPLEVLFEGAKKNPTVELYALRKEGEMSNLKTEKRKWLKYFSIAGSYQYGVMGVNSYMDVGSNLPIIYETSKNDQIFYNVGASMSINLGDIYDRKNSLKRQKTMIKQTEKEEEMWFEQQKLLIIDAYTTALAALAVLSEKYEAYTIAKAQYNLAEQSFILGKLDGASLVAQKNAMVQTLDGLQETKRTLRSSILRLEIYSNTKILSK
ncbi:MAG: TolC family protein [Bacteroidales bacterium]